jgi:hypothetical protein
LLTLSNPDSDSLRQKWLDSKTKKSEMREMFARVIKEWEESKHPRGTGGRFGEGTASSPTDKTSIRTRSKAPFALVRNQKVVGYAHSTAPVVLRRAARIDADIVPIVNGRVEVPAPAGSSRAAQPQETATESSSAGSRVPPTEAQVNAALAQWNEIGPIEGKVSPENIDIMARAVEFEGKPSSTELYRGLRVDSVGREGDVVNLPPSSFSRDTFTADPYAAGYGGISGTILHLPAGTLALDLTGRGDSYVNDAERESVVAGQFVIERVQYSAKDDNGHTWDEKYNHVYLRAAGA